MRALSLVSLYLMARSARQWMNRTRNDARVKSSFYVFDGLFGLSVDE